MDSHALNRGMKSVEKKFSCVSTLIKKNSVYICYRRLYKKKIIINQKDLSK